MMWVPQPAADKREIEAAMRRAYPNGRLDEVDGDALDQYLTGERLDTLLEAVAAISGLNAVMEIKVVRSHILHIGSEGAPDWEQLNREFSDKQRKAAVSASPGGILYWNVLLSRIGPYWTGYWNSFRLDRGVVVPEVVDKGQGEDWKWITKQVKATLRSFGLAEVSDAMLNAPVRWLGATGEQPHDSGSAAQPSTVYDGLFSDAY